MERGKHFQNFGTNMQALDKITLLFFISILLLLKKLKSSASEFFEVFPVIPIKIQFKG